MTITGTSTPPNQSTNLTDLANTLEAVREERYLIELLLPIGRLGCGL